MRVLVTGCAGFVGSHICEELLRRGDEVVGVDCLTDYYAPALKQANLGALEPHSRFRFHKLDIAAADVTSLVDGIDVVYHQAAQPGVRASWGQLFDVYLRNNVLATQRLLEALKGRPIRKFVYASSSSIYGDAESFPTSERAIPCPVSPYGATKLAGEHLASLYWRNYGVPTISLRYFTVYGPRQRPDMAFHKFARWALEGKPIEIYGDGRQTRDFTFISDAVAANIAAAECEDAGLAINIGGGSQVSVNDVVQMLAEIIGGTISVSYLEPQRGDVRDTCADTSLAAAVLGYAPNVGIKSGLAAEVQWVRSLLLDADLARDRPVREPALVIS